MTTYSTSEAQRNLDRVLEEASRLGRVEIRRSDGESFVVVPASRNLKGSGLDVPGVDADITTDEIVAIVREGREGRRE